MQARSIIVEHGLANFLAHRCRREEKVEPVRHASDIDKKQEHSPGQHRAGPIGSVFLHRCVCSLADNTPVTFAFTMNH